MRGYGDFVNWVSAFSRVSAVQWMSPDSPGAFVAMRADADARVLGGRPVFCLEYIRDRQAPGGLRAKLADQSDMPLAPGWWGFQMVGLALGRVCRNGQLDEAALREWVEHDPVMRFTPDGQPISLEMAALSGTLAHLREVMPSPARDRYPPLDSRALAQALGGEPGHSISLQTCAKEVMNDVAAWNNDGGGF